MTGARVITRSRLLAGIVLLVAAAVIVIAVLPSRGRSDSGSGSALTSTATINSRNLVETDTESGTLTYARTRRVYNRLSGTVTSLPRVGAVIKPGHALFKVDNQPVILLDGRTPAYRDLTSSDSAGPDIEELNRNLVKLGYDPHGVVLDDRWQWATTAGVQALQKAIGLRETGTLPLGRVVVLPGRQLVNTVVGSIGSGVTAGAAAPILQTSSTRLVATADLPASSQSEAVAGEHVTVEMPNGSTVGGRIAAVSRIAQGAGSRSSTIPVTISLDRRVDGAGSDRAAVSVNFARAKARHVLSVPVTALVATSRDGYAVEEAAAPHRLLPVRTGLFAAGYVQVAGPAIHPGLKVTDSQG